MARIPGVRRSRNSMQIPLFPLHTVLFPGGVLPLKVFEQRYIDMTKSCLAEHRPFGVCMITRGDEVAKRASAATPEFASIGTFASISAWEMPQLGILQLATTGGQRFKIARHSVEPSGLVVGEVTTLAPEPRVALTDDDAPLARLLEQVARHVDPRHFPASTDYTDASWVGYRLAELLPLPLPIKQSMLEINDAPVRLAVLRKFLLEQGVL